MLGVKYNFTLNALEIISKGIMYIQFASDLEIGILGFLFPILNQNQKKDCLEREFRHNNNINSIIEEILSSASTAGSF